MMKLNKLVLCCIAGILLGFLAPFVIEINRSTSLSIGMAAGLAIGYLADILDEKKQINDNTEVLSQKAKEANQLMERARAEISEKSASEPDDNEEYSITEDTEESSLQEEAEKINKAEEMLRNARDRIRK